MCLREKDKVVRWGKLYEMVETGQKPNDKHGLVNWGLPFPSMGLMRVLRGPNKPREQKRFERNKEHVRKL